MSGFQIPGLGFAKPNEKLPPLPVDQTMATQNEEPNTNQDIEIQDAAPTSETTNAPATITEQHNTETQNDASNAMAIDHPESPPSLTGALEAALGGLEPENPGPENAEEALGQIPLEQPQQNTDGQNATTAQAGHPEWEADSSPYESSSESSSSDSSDEDDSDNEGYELLGVEETARLLMEAEGGSDDDGDKAGKGQGSGQVRTKNELPEEVIPKPDVTITPEMKIEELGAVEHIVENLMLVKAFTPGEYQVLDAGSVLCTADRVVIGAVAETIGKVLQPMYTVHFTSGEEIKGFGIEVGTKIYYPADHASFVFTEPLKSIKGSDASNLHDEEVGDDEMEFSDDEKEAEYKRSLKQKKRDKYKNAKGEKDPQPHPLRQEMAQDGSLNYDEDDGPYKPLTRPPGFGNGPVSTETYDPHHRPGFHRGGRGRDGRGRGGRGRGSGRGGRSGGGGPRGGDGYSLPPQGSNNAVAATPPPPQWNQNGANMPAMPNFGFQMPGWPPAGQSLNSATPPLPPPPVPQQGGNAQNGAFLNPTFLAALMSMQAQNGGQNWQPHPPPPPPPAGGQ